MPSCLHSHACTGTAENSQEARYLSAHQKRGADAAVAGRRKAAAAAQAVTNINNSVLLAYYPAAGSGVEGYENYYLILSDKEDVSYNANEGQINAKTLL